MGLAKRTGLLMLISAACVIVLAFTTSTIATGSGGRLVGQWIGAGLVILAVSALGAALTRRQCYTSRTRQNPVLGGE